MDKKILILTDKDFCSEGFYINSREGYVFNGDVQIQTTHKKVVFPSLIVEGSLTSNSSIQVNESIIVKNNIEVEGSLVACKDIIAMGCITVSGNLEAYRNIFSGWSITVDGFLKVGSLNDKSVIAAIEEINVEGDIIGVGDTSIEAGQSFSCKGKVDSIIEIYEKGELLIIDKDGKRTN